MDVSQPVNLHSTDGLLYFMKGADFKWVMVAPGCRMDILSGEWFTIHAGEWWSREQSHKEKRGCFGTAGFQTGGVYGALVPAAGLPSPGDATQPRLLGS